MQVKRLVRIVLLLLLVSPIAIFAQHGNNEHTSEKHEVVNKESSEGAQKIKKSKERKEYIQHHLQDSYDFSVWHAMGWEFPLPIILWDEGLQLFSSSKFHHGESVAESNGNYYKIFHGKIYKTDTQGTITMDENHHPSNTKPLDFSITKNVFVIMLMAILIFVVFMRYAKSYKNSLVPNKGGKFLEPLVLFIRDEIAIPNIGEKHHRKYMSYLLTVFFFVWFLNLAGMTPLGITVTNNIAITFGLAMITFFITLFTSKKNYWLHIFWMPGVPIPMKFLLAPIELLGVFIKPFALMIRLYANMTAGHIVIMSLIALLYAFDNWLAKGAFLGLTLFLSIIELLVAFLQAYIFTMLSSLFVGMALHQEH
ncbi:MAG: F0F1 ATP synthase subunit A [Flavobacteriales bacterium]|nr:F0F1 ATP synthase subunit A [Flavobacteriales bacterium]